MLAVIFNLPDIIYILINYEPFYKVLENTQKQFPNSKDPDPLIVTRRGYQNCLQLSISLSSDQIIKMLFQQKIKLQKQAYLNNKSLIFKQIKNINNFQLKFQIECDSKVLPLVKKFNHSSETYHVQKIHNKIIIRYESFDKKLNYVITEQGFKIQDVDNFLEKDYLFTKISSKDLNTRIQHLKLNLDEQKIDTDSFMLIPCLDENGKQVQKQLKKINCYKYQGLIQKEKIRQSSHCERLLSLGCFNFYFTYNMKFSLLINIGLQNFLQRKIQKKNTNLKILTSWYISSYKQKHQNQQHFFNSQNQLLSALNPQNKNLLSSSFNNLSFLESQNQNSYLSFDVSQSKMVLTDTDNQQNVSQQNIKEEVQKFNVQTNMTVWLLKQQNIKNQIVKMNDLKFVFWLLETQPSFLEQTGVLNLLPVFTQNDQLILKAEIPYAKSSCLNVKFSDFKFGQESISNIEELTNEQFKYNIVKPQQQTQQTLTSHTTKKNSRSFTQEKKQLFNNHQRFTNNTSIYQYNQASTIQDHNKSEYQSQNEQNQKFNNFIQIDQTGYCNVYNNSNNDEQCDIQDDEEDEEKLINEKEIRTSVRPKHLNFLSNKYKVDQIDKKQFIKTKILEKTEDLYKKQLQLQNKIKLQQQQFYKVNPQALENPYNIKIQKDEDNVFQNNNNQKQQIKTNKYKIRSNSCQTNQKQQY